jgi:hypothetical protein
MLSATRRPRSWARRRRSRYLHRPTMTELRNTSGRGTTGRSGSGPSGPDRGGRPPPLVAHPQTAAAEQPRVRSLHHPAMAAQLFARMHASLGNRRGDAIGTEGTPEGRRVVGLGEGEVMVPYHFSPDRALEFRTEMDPNGSASPLPVLGIVLTTVGLLLVIAGLVDTPSPATPMHVGWLHSQDGGDLATMTRSRTVPRRTGPYPRVLAWSAQENAGFGGHWVSRATSSSRTRDDRIASAPVAVDPTVRTDSARMGTAPVSSGSEISSADLQQPRRLGRNCRSTRPDSARAAALPLCRDAGEAPPTIVAMPPVGESVASGRRMKPVPTTPIMGTTLPQFPLDRVRCRFQVPRVFPGFRNHCSSRSRMALA